LTRTKRAAAIDEAAVETAARSFGLHVAALRRSRKMTLDQLATRTGLNKGYLSRLERAEKAASIATALKIAQAFSVPVSTLFGEAVDDALIQVVRVKARPEQQTDPDRSSFTTLSRAGPGSGLEAFLLFPGSEFSRDGRVDHGGTEILFVLSGELEVQFADRTIALLTGDFLQFAGHLAHQVRALTAGASALVAVSIER
jgi:transcriptional regulator with XRE-family HTH domain